MTHTTPTGVTTLEAHGHPDDDARRLRAAIMRSLGSRRLHFPGSRTFVCNDCSVTWSGPEADCWSCGMPPTAEYLLPRAAQRYLRQGVIPTSPRAVRHRRPRKAGLR